MSDYAESFRLDLAAGWPERAVIEYARRHAEYLAFLPPEPERDKALADTLRLLREMEEIPMNDTDKKIALIKAHALNSLAHKPGDVTSHDRLFLIAEIERLQEIVALGRNTCGKGTMNCIGAKRMRKALEEPNDR